jgi:thiol-disulfide isomerase/thioredoxin
MRIFIFSFSVAFFFATRVFVHAEDASCDSVEGLCTSPPLTSEDLFPSPPPPPPPPAFIPPQPTVPASCDVLTRDGCDRCRFFGCAWCLNSRRCVPDQPWECQGETDHVGNVGTVKQCPTKDDLQNARARKKLLKDGTIAAAAAAAKKKAQEDIEAAANKLKEDSNREDAAFLPSDIEHISNLKQRAELSRSATTAGVGGSGVRYGASHPYETLDIKKTATAREVRRAYIYLSTRLHPDKNLFEFQEDAAAAFADLSAAYELLSDQALREAFDSSGSTGGDAFFHDETSFKNSGRDFSNDLYASSSLITELSEETFSQFVAGDRIWLLNFYTPWCSHCQAFVSSYKVIADQLSEINVDVGAINCLKHAAFCASFDIRAYPSIRMVSARHGMHQDAHTISMNGPDPIIEWVTNVQREWLWLFANANIAELDSESFPAAVQGESDEAKEFWLVLFQDGEDCGPCRVARSNIVRLAAGVNGLANVGILDCDAEEYDGSLCQRLGLPSPPHQPVIRAFRRGTKGLNYNGEELFDPTVIEVHLALQLTEKVLRLALAQEQVGSTAVSLGEDPEWTGEPTRTPSPSPPPPPPPQWNGAAPRPRQSVGAPFSGPPSAFGGFLH